MHLNTGAEKTRSTPAEETGAARYCLADDVADARLGESQSFAAAKIPSWAGPV